jgi:glycopeptide antibiotics resistance protein
VTVDLGVVAERYRDGRIILSPLRSPALTWDLLPSLIADLVMAAPVGVFMSLAGMAPGARRSAARAFMLGGGIFLIGELVQVFVVSRTADVVDLTAALVGVSIGAVLTASIGTVSSGQPGGAARARPALLMSLIAVTGLYVVYNWTPFDFNLSEEFVAGRVGRLLAVPFAGYYQNAEFKALSDATIKLSLSVPFGVLLQFLVRPDRVPYRRSATLLVLILATVFFAVVEFGQVLLPSRYPDNTDVLLAVLGVWAGMRFTRQFQPRAAA